MIEIEAGAKTKIVRGAIKTEKKTPKQDDYDRTADLLAPTIDVQSIDDNKTIKQLKKKCKDNIKWNGRSCTFESIT